MYLNESNQNVQMILLKNLEMTHDSVQQVQTPYTKKDYLKPSQTMKETKLQGTK